MLRVLLTPRWVGWTLLAALAVVVCGGMAYWQLIRAESPTGSLLNAGYALQWPLFGIFFATLWWRMLRLESRALDAVRGTYPLDGADPPDGTDRRDDPDAARRSEVEATPGVAGALAPAGRLAPLVSAGSSSPFTPRPAGVRPGAADAPPAPGSGRAEYNAMLAELARRDAVADTPVPRQERS